jgi:hypothetical protein
MLAQVRVTDQEKKDLISGLRGIGIGRDALLAIRNELWFLAHSLLQPVHSHQSCRCRNSQKSVRSLVHTHVLLQLKYALRFDLVLWRLGVLVCFVLEIGGRGKHPLSGGLVLEGIPRAVLGACAELSAC